MIKNKNRVAENEAPSTSTPAKYSTSTEKYTINKTASSTSIQSAKPTKCSIDSDEIVIPRKYGEGNKSLYTKEVLNTNEDKSSQKSYLGKRFSSSSSSSPERYRNIEKRRKDQKRDRNFKSLSPEKQGSTRKLDRIPYFADEKREEERLERKWKLSTKKVKKEKHSRESRDNVSERKSPRFYRRSRSNSRERSHHRKRRRSTDRRRRSRSKSYKRSRSRTRSRSRDKYRMGNASIMPPMFPVMIATPSSSDYFYGPQNWMPQFVPVTPSRFPGFIRPIVTPFPPMTAVPRYPIPVQNSRYNPHTTMRLPRTQRFKPPNRGFHRPRYP